MENIVVTENFYVRKSKWIVLFIATKVCFYILFLLLFIWTTEYLLSQIEAEQTAAYFIIWACVLLFLYYIFVSIISNILKYFFNVMICSGTTVMRVRVSLINDDVVDIIELFRVREIVSEMDSFMHVFLNFGNIVLLDNNLNRKVIHWIDHPKRVVLQLQKLKEKGINERKGVVE